MYTFPDVSIYSADPLLDLTSMCRTTHSVITCMHLYLFLVNKIFDYLGPSYQFLQACLSLVGMFIQIYGLAMSGEVIWYIHWNIVNGL